MLDVRSSAERGAVVWPRALAAHFPALDGVRALAFLFVFVDHWSLIWGWKGHSRNALEIVLFKLADAGWCGVDLFFVLSGFLITGILLETRGEPDYFANFYLRRALRIFPLYYGFLFVVFVALRPFLGGDAAYQALASRQLGYWLYLQNWSTATAGWPLFGMDHLWSLAVEEQFYLVWPVLVLVGGRAWTKRASIALVALAFALRLGLMAQPTFLYASTITRVDALAAGALVAAIAREPDGIATLRRWALPAMAAGLAGLAIVGAARHELGKLDPIVATFGFSLFAALFSGVIMFIVSRPAGHAALRALAAPRLRALGRISYAAYIVHYPLMRLVDLALPASMPAGGRLALGFALPAAGTVVLASWSWRLVESPLLRLKDRVSAPASQRVRAREAPPPLASR